MPNNWIDYVTPLLEDCIKKPPHKGAPMVAITVPPMWDYFSGECEPFYGFGVFEGDRVPQQWQRIAEKEFVKCVLVPSNHTKDAWINAGTKKRVEIVPHGYNHEVFVSEGNKLDHPDLKDDKFKVGFVGGWKDGVNDRKGLDILLRAFCEEFKPEEKISLHCKINMAYQSKDIILNNVESLKLPPKDKRPKISLYMNEWPEELMAQFYRTLDVMTIPTKADAFCMPFLESLACGTTVIAPPFGGQADVVNDKNSWLMEIEKYVPATGGIMYEESKWAIPSKEDLRKKLRYCFDNQEEVKKKGKEGIRVKDSWTWDHSADKLIKILIS